ncbi:hypothetical protein Hanom_Chr09g00765311 [Helianthus anomalus]
MKLKSEKPRCKRFEFWTKVAKVIKPHESKWQFTKKKNIYYSPQPILTNNTILWHVNVPTITTIISNYNFSL